MVINLTKEMFIEKISEFDEFKFKGNKPALIDFWAPWCGPCKMLSPTIEELSKEYNSKIDIYKINTDEESELASLFNIQSIPTLIFIPVNKEIKSIMGAIPKDAIKKVFKEIFNI